MDKAANTEFVEKNNCSDIPTLQSQKIPPELPFLQAEPPQLLHLKPKLNPQLSPEVSHLKT